MAQEVIKEMTRNQSFSFCFFSGGKSFDFGMKEIMSTDSLFPFFEMDRKVVGHRSLLFFKIETKYSNLIPHDTVVKCLFIYNFLKLKLFWRARDI